MRLYQSGSSAAQTVVLYGIFVVLTVQQTDDTIGRLLCDDNVSVTNPRMPISQK